jgi:hypothetical protein
MRPLGCFDLHTRLAGIGRVVDRGDVDGAEKAALDQ